MTQPGLIRIAGASLNQTPLDWNGNKNRIINAVNEAKQNGISVLCLPELSITGYNCEDMFHSSYVHYLALEVLHEILPTTGDIIVAIGLPLAFRGAVYNVACLIANQQIIGFTAKQNLANDGVHYEPRWFKPWPKGRVVDINVKGVDYKLGDLLYDVGGLRIGFEICQDAWVANRTGVALAERGIDLLLNPSASHFAFGKFKVRKNFVKEASRAFGVAYVYTNTLGNNAGRLVYDGEVLISTVDKFSQTSRFSFSESQLGILDVNFEALRVARARNSNVPQADFSKKDLEVKVSYKWPQLDEAKYKPIAAVAWEKSDNLKAEEFTRAVSLALFDYMRKSKAKGFVINLSGGADSAATAVLVYSMVQLAVAELGFDGFIDRLKHLTALQQAQDINSLMQQLLFCFYQFTENNTEITRNAAEKIATCIGAEFKVMDIQALVNEYVDKVGTLLQQQINWQQHDLALQNIQARVRGPGAWLVANLRGAVLLATSNRSEAAVGYTTMDGDTCGGLCAVGGIDKAYLLQWLHWYQQQGPLNLKPLPDLSYVNAQQPTAELKPKEHKQMDEMELMPYDLLDAIERLAIRDKLSPKQVLLEMKEKYAKQFTDEQLHSFIVKFFQLWAHNQWKRERFAPSFHVDDQNLDPKSWCRFPILSGNFERELQEIE